MADAIQVVCNRRKSANCHIVRYSGEQASHSEFGKDSPAPLEHQTNDQDCSSALECEPEEKTEGESKIIKSESTSIMPRSHVTSYAPSGFSRIDLKPPIVLIVEMVEERSTGEKSTTENSKISKSLSRAKLSYATSLESYNANRKMTLKTENTPASMTQRRLSTKSISGSKTKGRAGAEINERLERNNCSAYQTKEENFSHLWRKRGWADNSNTIEKAFNISMSFTESLFLQSDSILPDDFDGRPSTDATNQPGNAVPWMDITHEELDILGVPRSTESGWDME